MKGHDYNSKGCSKCGKIHKHTHNGGYSLSKETKEKIGIAMRARVLSKEHREKIGMAHKGVSKSKESCLKRSLVQKGKRLNHDLNTCSCGVCKAKRGEYFGDQNPFFGKAHKKETKSFLSDLKQAEFNSGKTWFKGKFYSIKNGREFLYRSNWELEYMKFLENSADVLQYKYEFLKISYVWEGIFKFTIPDFLVFHSDGSKEVVEVRPEWRLTDAQTKFKMEAVDEFCLQHGLKSTWIYNYTDTNGFMGRTFPFIKEGL